MTLHHETPRYQAEPRIKLFNSTRRLLSSFIVNVGYDFSPDFHTLNGGFAHTRHAPRIAGYCRILWMLGIENR